MLKAIVSNFGGNIPWRLAVLGTLGHQSSRGSLAPVQEYALSTPRPRRLADDRTALAKACRHQLSNPGAAADSLVSKCEADLRTQEKRAAKQRSRLYSRFMSNDSHDVAVRYKVARRSLQAAKSPHMPHIKENGTDKVAKFKTPEAIAGHFRDSFWHHSEDAQAPLPKRLRHSQRYRSRKTIPQSFGFDCVVTEAQVRCVLRDLQRKGKKAPGPSGIGLAALQLLCADHVPKSTDGDGGPEMAEPNHMSFEHYLAIHFTHCLQAGYFPDVYKLAMTLVLPKGKTPVDIAKNFRPVSLLEIIGKLLERIVAWRLRDLTVKHNKAMELMPFHQFAVAGKSTTDALYFYINKIYRAWDEGHVFTQLQIDFSNAYCLVNPEALMEILARKCLPPELLHFFTSYLAPRITTCRKITSKVASTRCHAPSSREARCPRSSLPTILLPSWSITSGGFACLCLAGTWWWFAGGLLMTPSLPCQAKVPCGIVMFSRCFFTSSCKALLRVEADRNLKATTTRPLPPCCPRHRHSRGGRCFRCL